MALYIYTCLDSKGQRKTGTVDARSKDAAVSLLKEQGLYVVSLSEKTSSQLLESLEFSKTPFGEVVSFTRQLSTMISAGLSISKALDVLAQQTTHKKFKRNLLDILRAVEGGSSLANAFAQFPDIFNPTYTALVEAGEASGKLDAILNQLAETMEAERELRAKFKAAMIYPTIVMIAMVGVFIILMTFVVPRLAEMYESLDVELPVVTRFMISISDFMTKYILFVLLGLVGGVLGLRYALRTESVKIIRSKIMFKIPIFGSLSKKKELTEFTRTLGLLIASAVPIVQALNIVSDVVSSNAYKQGALAAAKRIEKGGTLSSYLKGDQNFPPIIGNMVATGEETGKLDDILKRLSDFFAKETDHAVEGLSAALEPVILIMLGSMVGFLIISIITPIYKITSAL